MKLHLEAMTKKVGAQQIARMKLPDTMANKEGAQRIAWMKLHLTLACALDLGKQYHGSGSQPTHQHIDLACMFCQQVVAKTEGNNASHQHHVSIWGHHPAKREGDNATKREEKKMYNQMVNDVGKKKPEGQHFLSKKMIYLLMSKNASHQHQIPIWRDHPGKREGDNTTKCTTKMGGGNAQVNGERCWQNKS